MVTVRQLLELMYDYELIRIVDEKTDTEEFSGTALHCKTSLLKAVLDCSVTKIHSSADLLIYI